MRPLLFSRINWKPAIKTLNADRTGANSSGSLYTKDEEESDDMNKDIFEGK